MDMASSAIVPWIEKYRPTKFTDIVFDRANRAFFDNVRSQSRFPNMLFYGPPGTGKTTTVLNLIAARTDVGATIHLNASDDRGIDVVRSQIQQFARTQNLFSTGLKFVVLDEVDYMTKGAQQALKYLVSTCAPTVRFCLICNYITKIDETLRNEFICVRFNQLPEAGVLQYLRRVADAEQIAITDADLRDIRHTYMSDLRGMINYMQQSAGAAILGAAQLDALHARFGAPRAPGDADDTVAHICEMCVTYNVDPKTVVQRYFNHIIRSRPGSITKEFMRIAAVVIHSTDTESGSVLNYFCSAMHCLGSGHAAAPE
jgi:replication factor C subunit 3/5